MTFHFDMHSSDKVSLVAKILVMTTNVRYENCPIYTKLTREFH